MLLFSLCGDKVDVDLAGEADRFVLHDAVDATSGTIPPEPAQLKS